LKIFKNGDMREAKGRPREDALGRDVPECNEREHFRSGDKSEANLDFEIVKSQVASTYCRRGEFERKID
jgi:hypothetical protein